jgi:hypothetical protein
MIQSLEVRIFTEVKWPDASFSSSMSCYLTARPHIRKARWKEMFQSYFPKKLFLDCRDSRYLQLKTHERKWLLSSLMHQTKGSPLKPTEQVHIGLWFTTWQLALKAHMPEHGSKHFWFIQALSWGQSVLTIHSGLHAGGEPTCPAWHEQTGCSPTTWHSLYSPHKEGKQGFFRDSYSVTTTKGRDTSQELIVTYTIHAIL